MEAAPIVLAFIVVLLMSGGVLLTGEARLLLLFSCLLPTLSLFLLEWMLFGAPWQLPQLQLGLKRWGERRRSGSKGTAAPGDPRGSASLRSIATAAVLVGVVLQLSPASGAVSVTSVTTANAPPLDASLLVTVTGSGFLLNAAPKVAVRTGGTACELTTWVSDSTLVCQVETSNP